MSFHFLEPGEQVVLIVRRHWFVFFARALFFALLAATPLIFLALMPSVVTEKLLPEGSVSTALGFLYVVWLIVLWIFLFIQWTVYFLDVWVVTDQRLIDVQQRWLFHRSIVTARLDRIQNVGIDVEGLLATLIGFGNIRILTAGDDPDIIIRTARHPERMRARILELHNTAVEKLRRVSIGGTE